MDEDKATRFVSSLVKSIQALCNGYIDFSTSIEVIGHIHLNIDRCVKLDYVLTEEVSKSISEGATVFASHSYHSQPPCSSKTSSDASEHPRQKSGHRGRDEADPLGFNSLSSEVPSSKSKTNSHSQNQSSSRFGESSDSSHSGNFSVSFDNDSIKQESDRTSQGQNSLDVRRRSALSQNAQSPAAKRSRSEDSGPKSTMMSSDSPEVIEIKEEPDDEPTVYFGDTSAHAGQDLQTPDFSNVVMESLDRVGQVEGAQLVTSGEGMPLQQHAPFPVMMHHGTSLSSSSASSSGGPLPGPSLSDPQASASTSGGSAHSSLPHLSSSSAPGLLSNFPSPRRCATAVSGTPPRHVTREDGGPSGLAPAHIPTFPSPVLAPYYLHSRLKKLYSPQQMMAAIADVDRGKPVSRAAQAHGVPLRSLYRKLKNRRQGRSAEDMGAVPSEETWPST